MATRLYKIYPASSYNNLDLSKFTSNVVWNLANTEFIVEFIEQPHGNVSTLTHEEAIAITNGLDWTPKNLGSNL